jgi:hypothetical protein
VTDDTTRPEILSLEDEREILFSRVCGQARIALSGMRPDLTVAEAQDVTASLATAGALQALRVMSARQLAVLLAKEAGPGVRSEIREPPHYPAEETGNVS